MSHTSVELPLAVETSVSLEGSEESADVRWRLTPFRLVLAKGESADVRRRFIPFPRVLAKVPLPLVGVGVTSDPKELDL